MPVDPDRAERRVHQEHWFIPLFHRPLTEAEVRAIWKGEVGKRKAVLDAR
jgi:hypothetical protein